MQYQQKFLEIIKNPYELNDQSLAVLQKLAADYPYCQSLQILLAKNLQLFNKLEFEKQVNKASAYAIDRRKFQRYISDRDRPAEPVLVIEQPMEVVAVSIPVETPVEQEVSPIDPDITEVPEEAQTLLHEAEPKKEQVLVPEQVQNENQELFIKPTETNHTGDFIQSNEEAEELLGQQSEEVTLESPTEQTVIQEIKSGIAHTEIHSAQEPEPEIRKPEQEFSPEIEPEISVSISEVNIPQVIDTEPIQPVDFKLDKQEEKITEPVKTNPVESPTSDSNPKTYSSGLLDVLKKKLQEIRTNHFTKKQVTKKADPKTKREEKPIKETETLPPQAAFGPKSEEISNNTITVEANNNGNTSSLIETPVTDVMAESDKPEPVSKATYQKTAPIISLEKEDLQKDVSIPEPKISGPKSTVKNPGYGSSFTEQERLAQKPDINQLIDKFLKEEPRIQMRKDLPEKQEDLSASSTYEHPQLVTETLAQIYNKQGNKVKALDIYEKLCLKFPEKSSYFAQKILDIKKEINF
jgi:hypothetical protein